MAGQQGEGGNSQAALHLQVEGHVQAAGVLLGGLQPQSPAQLLDLVGESVPIAEDGNVIACTAGILHMTVNMQCSAIWSLKFTPVIWWCDST